MPVPITLSSRLQRIQPSITMAITAKAKSMRAEGVDVVSFGAGEPDFDTPEHIKQAARNGLDTGVAKYTSVVGIEALREAVVQTMQRVHGITALPDQVIVSCGAKHSLFNVLLALLNPGDEVIIPAPYWVSYPDMVRLAEGKPVIVPTTAEENFTLSAEALATAVSPRSRVLILNTPSNPTGSVYSKPQLEALAEVVLKNNLLVISDDIYRCLVYGDIQYTSIASLGKDIAANTILVDGVSKAYAMTGWRIGFTTAPKPLVQAMAKIQGQSTSGASHIAQVAAVAALSGSQACVEHMRGEFDKRRVEVVKRLRAIPEVTCREPQGAFYAFPDLSAYIGRKTKQGTIIKDDVALCEHILVAGKTAIVPGSGFGAPGFARISYACSMQNIERGIDRIQVALQNLS